ncbi:hypothetical protein ED733_005229 [Metarhizium rileyi]|uniref:non-specific serine/threonine protein kinase n=1 Tax=Metarhizium rileyi (strain RCEF 4871) TaxID=1649241 RepID=A0A5C6GMC1_METRR|nr:hypothetical protein ED733_005229 [Metarhizium rileyi]
MTEEERSRLIEQHPIGRGLDAFRASFTATCEKLEVESRPDALAWFERKDLENITIPFLFALLSCEVSDLLLLKTGRGTLRDKLKKIISATTTDEFDFDHIKPLLRLGLVDEPDDTLIWHHVYDLVIDSTPPPRSIASSLLQTPWLHNTSSFANSSEYRKDVDRYLMMELGPTYVGLCRFYEVFFERIDGLENAAEAVFKKCMEGAEPLFNEAWSGWPRTASQDEVLSWFADISNKFTEFADESRLKPLNQRRLLAQPNKPIHGSTGERKLDVGFVDDPEAGKTSRCRWEHILVPGELKSNPSADRASKAWLDLGTYAREVLAAQDNRRFILGFTICGSLMRIWEFDRLGAIASEQFDINKDGLQFVTTILGFLWMNDEELGFDPTIKTKDGKRFFEINRKNSTERLIIDEVMQRARCIAGRATTCWKVHREGCPEEPLVVKDSWQYPERDEEGQLLLEATEKNVVNVAQYYHHETVQICGKDDDVRNNIRGGLDVTRATNYRPGRSKPLPMMTSATSRQGRSSVTSQKRTSSQIGAPLPYNKRSCSVSPMKPPVGDDLSNRVHRRVVLRDYGIPIYWASTPSILLSRIGDCLQGHQSLLEVIDVVHRDISINNLLMNSKGFLIDLDLAIKTHRLAASGAKGKTGTRAFMSIGALLGEEHSFMHDLESFFWVLFWTCIHYVGPGNGRVVKKFDYWNYADTEELATLKLGMISTESLFAKTMTDYFTPHYKVLIPVMKLLRQVVFPKDRPWQQDNMKLYSQMQEILQNSLV